MFMISTVTLLGLAGDPIPGHPDFRYIDLETREAIDERPYFSKIPVCYWDRGVSNYLLRIPKGHLVVIFGRIESEPTLGLMVVVEQIRHFESNLAIHRRPSELKQD